ncbi:MAG: hypothetical protein P8075_11620 [Deltaproteobacteria bacterium]|jgi:hypothetical protein
MITRKIIFIFLIFLLSSCSTSKLTSPSFRGIPDDIGAINTKEDLFHGAYSWQVDEFESLLILLGVRSYASLSLLTTTILSKELHKKYLQPRDFRNSPQLDQAIEKTGAIFKILMKDDKAISVGLDYLGVLDVNRQFETGEGFPLVEKYKRYLVSMGVPVDGKSLKSLRYIVFTSTSEHIARKYGKVILKINDRRMRGLSLPLYCIMRHGVKCLIEKRNKSYSAPHDWNEYIFPGYISSDEVREILIAYRVPRNYQYSSVAYRLITLRYHNDIVVTLVRERDHEIIAEFAIEGKRGIMSRIYDDSDAMTGTLAEKIDKYNAESVKTSESHRPD